MLGLRILLCLMFIGLASSARAGPVLWIDDSLNKLGKIDVATGAASVVGPLIVNGTVTDLAFDPSGNLWAITFDSIYRVDKNTGAATFVGTHGISNGNALVFAADGTLYAAGASSTGLFRINTLTGAGTFLGSTGFASAGDLAFNGGHLFLSSTTNQLIEINTATPALSFAVGSMGVGNVFGLATADDGILYATSGQNVYTVNTSTGLATFKSTWAGSPMFQAFGTAFVTEAGAPDVGSAPEPGTLALIAVGLSGLALRRRNRKVR